ncbi:MAG: sigma-54-dependent Fis family transcriptional regulator [Deltaproteobacteria bacterium]|nr:sigma-54-dependent Fis family transcriptional regulator [Deltaproteobacteria bacterium]
MEKILVVDDQRHMRTTLALMLRGAGYDVQEAGDGEQAIGLVGAGDFDLVITDLRMSPRNGFDVLRAVRSSMKMAEVIVMTAFGTIESAVEAMRLGAHDYIQKPFTEQELLMKVDRALANRRLAGEVQLLAREFKERYKFENIIGRSEAIRAVLGRIVRVAPTEATVLITGESGTGKELVAKAIHANSRRADRPFVPVNCAAITETLLEGELFGHVRGAFTGAVSDRKGLFEEADGGTFFFDEISETSLSFQAKLLRAIEAKEIRRVGENRAINVDVRIIAATNRDLHESVAKKQFREDLYYRLNVVRFVLPPLRERVEDIPLLVEFFLERFRRKHGKNVRAGEGVVDALMKRSFPGNVREIENLIEQAVALADGGPITVEDVTPIDGSSPEPSSEGRTLAAARDGAERKAIKVALRAAGGNRAQAARALGISPITLWRRMSRLEIEGKG